MSRVAAEESKGGGDKCSEDAEQMSEDAMCRALLGERWPAHVVLHYVCEVLEQCTPLVREGGCDACNVCIPELGLCHTLCMLVLICTCE